MEKKQIKKGIDGLLKDKNKDNGSKKLHVRDVQYVDERIEEVHNEIPCRLGIFFEVESFETQKTLMTWEEH